MPRQKLRKPATPLGQFAQECPEVNDESWLRNAYEIEGKTQRQIAEELNITVGWVKVKFREFGIKGRPPSVRNKGLTRTPEQRVAMSEARKEWWAAHPEKRYIRPTSGSRENRDRISRQVAAKMLGRPLTPEEVVHHIDENPSNDAPENLFVFANRGDHTSFHAYLRRRKKYLRVKQQNDASIEDSLQRPN